MEFFKTALDIFEETVRLTHKQKLVPKSYRFTFAEPMCATARSMIQNIERSDAFYPNTSWAVIERKKYLALAIADVNALYDDLACLIAVRGGARRAEVEDDDPTRCGINLNELSRLLDLLEFEASLLQKAKNGVKLLGKESDESKLEAAEAEAQRLRDLITLRESVRV
jgi:hypothetical protein